MAFYILAERDQPIDWRSLNLVVATYKIEILRFIPVCNNRFQGLGIAILNDDSLEAEFSKIGILLEELKELGFRLFDLYSGKEIFIEEDFVSFRRVLLGE